ncbi:XTP/dITP diphosphatase [bacterium]
MTKIIVATNNEGKLKEINHSFTDIKNIEFISLKKYPQMPEIIEDGKTLEENAIKKARETALFTKKIALADDTGLEVDALGSAPGVFSARYAGENATYDDNNNKLLEELKNIEYKKRTACFKTVMALVFPDGKVFRVEGKCDGIILRDKKGTNGFGYDPLFFVPEKNKTFGEMYLEEKNLVSHRARALKGMKEVLKKLVFD